MFYTQKKLGWLFDWEKVKEHLEENYKVEEVRFYVGRKKNDEQMEKFLKALRKIRFKIFSKPLKLIKSSKNPRGEEKANFDVEITRDILLDILWFKKEWQGVVFLSGDSDFASLFWDLKKIFKKKIFVYSSRSTLSWELRLAATKHFFLEDLKKIIFRRNWDLTKPKNHVINKLLNRRSS